MSTINPVLAEASVGISALKKNPMAIIKHADGSPVAVLNRNRPVFYAVPAAAWEAMLNKIEDLELAALVRERAGEDEIEIDINEREDGPTNLAQAIHSRFACFGGVELDLPSR